MNYLKRLLVIAGLLLCGSALAQSSPQTYSRIRDGALPNNLANVYQFQITFPATYYGLLTASGTYYYDGDSATFRRWWGKTAGADNITNATPFPWVGNFNYVFDGVTWDRVRSDLWDASITTNAGPVTVSLTSFFNGVAGQYWTGETWDTAIAGNVAPLTLSLDAFYDTGTATGYRWQGKAVDDAMGNPTAPYTISLDSFYNGVNYQRWTGGSLTGSINAPVTGPYVGAIAYGYDATGPTYYPLKTDANGLFVHQADLLAGEDPINDWRKVRVQSVNPYTPTQTTTAAVDNSGTTVILASTEILGYSQYTISVKNTGGVNSITSVVTQVSPNGTDWFTLDTYSTAIVAGGIARVVSVINNSDRYLRVLGATTAATTSTDCYFTGRVSN